MNYVFIEVYKLNFLMSNFFFRNHAEITKRMMEKIQEQTEIVEVKTYIIYYSTYFYIVFELTKLYTYFVL